MINESVQYNVNQILQKSLNKDLKGKKLQVGSPRLYYDFEVSCQTGHLVMESESQTENNETLDEMEISLSFAREQLEERTLQRYKEYSEKEIQLDIDDDEEMQSGKSSKSKKIQIGHPRLNDCRDVECQSGHIMSNINTQTEIDESMIVSEPNINAEASLMLDDMINESVQYNVSKNNIITLKTDMKGKKLQVGAPRLDYDFEVSCQTGHLVMESECQSENNEILDEIEISSSFSREQSEKQTLQRNKEYSEKEIQVDNIDDEITLGKSLKAKKIQVGHPRLNACRNVECQSGYLMDDVGVQSDIDEYMIISKNSRKEEAKITFDEMINESIQYNVNLILHKSLNKELKGKKLQVGSPMLGYDYEVSCQTGHLIMESECQTENNETLDEIEISHIHSHEQSEEQTLQNNKEYSEKEIQFDNIDDEMTLGKSLKAKKIQVGHPRLNTCRNVECQSGYLMDDVGVQNDIDVCMIISKNSRKEEAKITFDEMINESIQYNVNQTLPKSVNKELKGKKLQVGSPMLGYDYEVSCQTGHLIMESECQTENYGTLNEIEISHIHSREQSEKQTLQKNKEYSEKEIQFDIDDDDMTLEKTFKAKKIQVGHPRLNNYRNVECQSGCLMDDVGVQSDSNEYIIISKNTRKEEAKLEFDEMINESIQYKVNQIIQKSVNKELKVKKLQVGSPMLGYDYEVSCQTGHLIIDSQCQTEDIEILNEIEISHIHSREQSEKQTLQRNKEYSEKEIQFDNIDDEITSGKSFKAKKIQVGHPRLNACRNVECQSKYLTADVGVQHVFDEYLIISKNSRKEEAKLEFDEMINESIQYNVNQILQKSLNKELKGKKLQVGSPMFEYNFEVSCQTGHLIMESECQTENNGTLDEIEISHIHSHEQAVEQIQQNNKKFSDKEIQFDIDDDDEMTSGKSFKAKKIQVGHNCRNVECQSGYLTDDVGIQSDFDEYMIISKNSRKEEAKLEFAGMINESIQYNVNQILQKSVNKDLKGKKLQVGSPMLGFDYEVSCQTGHLITESECQTEDNEILDELEIPIKYVNELSKENTFENKKEFSEKEIQFDFINIEKSNFEKSSKVKEIQVGLPRLNDSIESSCQSLAYFNDISVQTEIVEFMIMFHKERNQETYVTLDMIDEVIQYSKEDNILIVREHKGKKLQVGNPRINDDFDVSCQTDYLVRNIKCQTEDNISFDEKDVITLSEHEKSEILKINKGLKFSDKEIQFDAGIIIDDKSSYTKFVQVGESIFNEHRDAECQVMSSVKNIGIQNDLYEMIIIENNERNEFVFAMLDEVVQYYALENDYISKKNIGKCKKLQVGQSRLLSDSNAFTQTDIFSNDSFTMTLNPVENFSKYSVDSKEFLDKEVLAFNEKENDSLNRKIFKGKSVQIGYPRLDACVDFEGQYNYLIDSNELLEIENSEQLIIKDSFSHENVSRFNLIDETSQYSVGKSVTDFSVVQKIGKKLQVGSARLDIDRDFSCQTSDDKDSRIQTDFADSKKNMKQQKEYLNKEIEPDYSSVSELTKFRSVPVGLRKTDAFQNFDNRLDSLSDEIDSDIKNNLGLNSDKQYQYQQPDVFQNIISVGTASWDYDMNKYNLLTFDLQFGTQLIDKVSLEKSLKSNICSDICRNALIQTELDVSDGITQTVEYRPSHSVSLQISPKLSKLNNEAELLLNYFNKQIDIQEKYQPKEFSNCDIQKDFTYNLCDKFVQYSKQFPNYKNQLTDFQFVNSIIDFTQQFDNKIELCDRLVSFIPRKSTYDFCFEFDSFEDRSSENISMIPKYSTKDYISLFESKAVQDNFGYEEIMEQQLQDQENKAEETDNENQIKRPGSVEISLMPKLIKSFSHPIEMIDKEVMYFEASLEHDSTQIIENKHLDEQNFGYVEISLAPKLSKPELINQEIMYKSEKTFVECSLSHNCFEENQICNNIILENSTPESIEINLSPKLIDIKLKQKMEFISTEVEILERNVESVSPRSIKCDSKMTSMPELVKKSNFGTQTYIKPLYDGQCQTNISTDDYGVKTSSSTSPDVGISSEELSKHLDLDLLKPISHESICSDVYFDEDYIVECVKSRSVVTKKQEVLPNVSHDFVDKEEHALMFVTNKDKTKPKLCSTKTQSYDHNSKNSENQTTLEFCFRDDELFQVYKKMVGSRKLKEQETQESNDDNLFDILLKNKGLNYIICRYQNASNLCEESNQTELHTLNSTKTHYDPVIVKSSYVDQDNATSIVSSYTNRPSHKNKRIQRGCSYFKMKDADTNTDIDFGDNIEVTYTETILEESVITKRPLSKLDDQYDFSKSSSLTRRSTSATSIPVSNQSHKYVQSKIYPLQIFLDEENCDQYLTFIKSFHVTSVYDQASRNHLSLKDSIKKGILNLENNTYSVSNTSLISIEKSIEEGLLITKHDI